MRQRADETEAATGADAGLNTVAAEEDRSEEQPGQNQETEAIRAERDRKLKQYERDMDDYNERIKKARDKVQELNFRFAEWYYVVTEDEYRKIHLSRSDVVTESEEAAAEGDDIDAFRMLEGQGLSREAESGS